MAQMPEEVRRRITLERDSRNNPPKPIETTYRGHRFRSRTEARWAVFFDTLNIKWVYEPEGFDLNGIRYLPDFWLDKMNCYIEIKGKDPDVIEREKLVRLAASTNKSALMIIGQPGQERILGYVAHSCGLSGLDDWVWKISGCCGAVGFGPTDPDEVWILEDKCTRDWCYPSSEYVNGIDYPYDARLREACWKARSERFGT